MTDPAASPSRHGSQNPALVAGAWLVVTLPLAWGVYNTVKTSAKLFQNTPAPATTPSSTPVALTTLPTAATEKANP